jgi:Ca2+-binding EF-hand superfamily protein
MQTDKKDEPMTSEKLKKIEYFKKKIKEVFDYIDIPKKGEIKREEVAYIIRYFNRFPSESVIMKDIIRQLEEDEPSDYVKYNKLETLLLNMIIENQHEPDPMENLLAAFKILDTEGKGFIKENVMQTLLMNIGIKFDIPVYQKFKEYAVDRAEPVIYYEDYVAKLVEENEKHWENIMKDYDADAK